MTSVTEADVIHATRKDIPRIFRIRYESLEGMGSQETLVLAETADAKSQWMRAISTLHIDAKSLGGQQCISAVEIVDSDAFPEVKKIQCAARVNNRIFVGSANGLYIVDCNYNMKTSVVGDLKKVVQIEVLRSENSLLVLGGKSSQLRVYNINAAFRNKEQGIKISESKVGEGRGVNACFCGYVLLTHDAHQ